MNEQANSVYLDYAASTPVHTEVLKAMKPYWRHQFGNPQSSHRHGQKAKEGLNAARREVAKTLKVQPTEIIFTSGATEANNLAMQGRLKQGEERTAVVSAGSHPSMVSDTTLDDSTVSSLQLNADSRIDITAVEHQVSDDTAIVSVPYVNSATGVIEPLRDISNALDSASDDKAGIFHTDASQAGCFLPLQPEPLGVDMMTINSHKLYGPKGVGLLWVRSGTPLSSLFLSGAHRAVGDYQMVRPGTPPVPLIVGFARALSIAQENYKQTAEDVKELRDNAIKKLHKLPIEITINGDKQGRVANNINFSIRDANHDYMAARLSKEGVSVATSTACQSSKVNSGILKNIPDTPDTGLRVTLGVETTKKEIDVFITKLQAIITS